MFFFFFFFFPVRNKLSQGFLFNNTGWIISPDLDGDFLYDFNVRYMWKVRAASRTATVVTDPFMVDLIGRMNDKGTCIGDRIEVRHCLISKTNVRYRSFRDLRRRYETKKIDSSTL